MPFTFSYFENWELSQSLICAVFSRVFLHACLWASFRSILIKQMECTFYLCKWCQENSLWIIKITWIVTASKSPQNFSTSLDVIFTSRSFWFLNLNIIKWESSTLFSLCHFSCDLILSNWNKLYLISCSIIARQPQAMETQHSVSIKQFSVVRDIFFNRNEWACMKQNVTIIWSLLRGRKGIDKIPKPLSMVGQLNGFFFLIVLGHGVPQTFNFLKKICNC